MTLTQLERRIANLEQKLSQIGNSAGPVAPSEINAWIDDVHGTFQNDATYRHATKLGRQYRKSHRNGSTSRKRKTASK